MQFVEMGAGDDLLVEGLAVRRSLNNLPRMTCRMDPHAHGFHQVTLLLSSLGRSEWRVGEECSVSGLAAGHVIVVPAYVSTQMNGGTPFEAVTVRLSTGYLTRVAGQIGRNGGGLRPTAIVRDPFIEDVVQKLADESQAAGVGRDLLANSLGTALAVHLLRDYAGEDRAKASAGLSDEELIQVKQHVENYLDADLSVGRLADLVRRSPYHFIRQFRAATGTTPHQYVIRRRVERARDLLIEGAGIAQAAARVGFSSQSHLHQHVRRLLGVTPGALARCRPHGERRP